MALGQTVEHFDYNKGDTVYVVRLKAISRPVLRRDTEDNKTVDIEQAPIQIYQPEPVVVSEPLKEACWRRFSECHTYCVGLNRKQR